MSNSSWIFGAMIGFGVAVLAWTGLGTLGIKWPRLASLAFDAFGIVLGAYLGSLGVSIRRSCATMAVILGIIGFSLGFVGPLLLQPKLPQGPLLGLFVTGPWGVIAGALLGLLIGVARHGYKRAGITHSLN